MYRILDLSHFSRTPRLLSLEKTRHVIHGNHARRGNILDRNGEILATSATKIIIGVDPYAASVKKDGEKFLILADVLGIPHQNILDKLPRERVISNGKISKVRWKPICTIGEIELLHAVERLQIGGVYGIRKNMRIYPFGNKCAHILGFVNGDGEAVCGVERYMDFYLRGQDGFVASEKDGRGRELVQYRVQNISARDGYDVILTIDIKIQRMVADELKKLAETLNPTWASIIVSDAVSGELLAIGNHPTYDPNNYGKCFVGDMRNRAISDLYEPGSVLKIVSTSLALDQGLVDDDSIFDCSQETVTHRGTVVKLPRDPAAFGKLSYVDVIRKSSNRGAAFMALMLGEKQMYDGLKLFGFGSKTGYGFDSEASGILRTPDRWDAMTITRLAMGHVIAVTPIQTHYAMSVFASGGLLLSPQLFKSVSCDSSNILKFEPKIKRRVLPKHTADHMKGILNNPIYGKLKREMAYCGKTGTSQKIVNGKYSHERHVGSFSGFFPAENPKIVITVVVDGAHVKSGVAWGTIVALPVFKSLAEKIAQYYNL
jgi:cell division protein FtsI/penicillin-binding protein 2